MVDVVANVLIKHHPPAREPSPLVTPHTPTSPAHDPSTHQAYEEARDSATESTPVVEEAMFFWAASGDKARLITLLDRGTTVVNIFATDKVKLFIE